MRARFRGKVWEIVDTHALPRGDFGDIDAPNRPGKRIRIRKGLPPAKRLEIEIHEALHACFWDIDEEGICESARDLARFLLRRGWRCE